MAVVTMAALGRIKLRRMLLNDALRHARSGPIPVRKRRNRPIGSATRLKKGAPTVTLLPCTYSEMMGKSVPHRMVKQAASKTRLLNRKLDSRETSDSSLCSDFRWSRLRRNVNRQTESTSSKNPENQLPMEDWAKACTELTRPDRVRSVPRMHSMNVLKISHTFQFFIMPRFSCIMTECRNAVPVSQGMRED